MPAVVQRVLRLDRPVGAALDAALDAGLVAFAAWTLVYQVALAGQWSLWLPGMLWGVLAVAGVVAWSARAAAGAVASGAVGTSTDSAGSGPAGRRGWIHLVLVLALVVAVALRDQIGVLPVVAVAVALVGWGLVDARSAAIAPVDHPWTRAVPARGHHLIATGACLLLGVLALFLLRPDADDAYYVNRATWIAQHGIPVIRDTMFTPAVWPSTYGGGLPLASVEGLQGALAHTLGLQAPTFAYLVFGPVAAVAAGWATWRLVRLWAPRRQLLALLLSLLFMLLSAESVVGSYSVGRIWQGKVVAYAILLPLVWTYLSRLLERPARREVMLLAAAGVGFVGLTSASSLLAPAICAAGLLGALLVGSRWLAAGALAFVVAPLIQAVVVILGPGQVGGVNPEAPDGSVAFTIVFGVSAIMAALALLGLTVVPRLVPAPFSALLYSGSLATLAALVPGVLWLVNAATGAGPVAWRLLLVLPVWVLVGLLVTWVPPSAARSRAQAGWPGLIAVALLLAVVIGGRPIWSPTSDAATGGHLAAPGWKVDRTALADVRALGRRDLPPGLRLLPAAQMQVMAISDTRHFAVVPRDLYLSGVAEGPGLTARVVLYRLVSGAAVPVRRVRASLQELDVSVACVPGESDRARRVLRAAVEQPLLRVGSMRCHLGLVEG